MTSQAVPFLLRAQFFDLGPGHPIWRGRIVNWPVMISRSPRTAVPVTIDPAVLTATPFAIPVHGALAALDRQRHTGTFGLYFNVFDELRHAWPRVIGEVVDIEAVRVDAATGATTARTFPGTATWHDLAGDSGLIPVGEDLVVTVRVTAVEPLSAQDVAYLEQQRAIESTHCRIEGPLPALLEHLGPARCGDIGQLPLRKVDDHWQLDPNGDTVEIEFSQARIIFDNPPMFQSVPPALPNCGHPHWMEVYAYIPPQPTPRLRPSVDEREFVQQQRDFYTTHNPDAPDR